MQSCRPIRSNGRQPDAAIAANSHGKAHASQTPPAPGLHWWRSPQLLSRPAMYLGSVVNPKPAYVLHMPKPSARSSKLVERSALPPAAYAGPLHAARAGAGATLHVVKKMTRA